MPQFPHQKEKDNNCLPLDATHSFYATGVFIRINKILKTKCC